MCHRLGIKGFPTISVLDGDRIYDYQGMLTVHGLSTFITDKIYLEKSKARRISHVTSAVENLFNAMAVAKMKMRAMTMLVFRALGFAHLEEDFVINLVFMCALTPFLLYLIALVIERRNMDKIKEEVERSKASVREQASS